MVFRLTPVLLVFFLGALLATSSFMMWVSYQNAQEALESEQLKYLRSKHELAEQYFNLHLEESKRDIKTLMALNFDETSKRLSNVFLEHSIWDYAVLFEKTRHGDMPIIETYGHITEASQIPLRNNDHWYIEDTERGLSITFQYEALHKLPSGKSSFQILKAGIYLKDNLSLMNAIRKASNAEGHQLIYSGKVLSSSLSLEPGVAETAQKVLSKFSPIIADSDNIFGGDVIPLRIDKGVRGLYLISISRAQERQDWNDSFKLSVIMGLVFVLFIASIVTFLLRKLTNSSLGSLLSFTSHVQSRGYNKHFQPGKIREFNEVGSVIEKMVVHLSEQANYITGLVESANSPIISWDNDGVINIYNKAAISFFGSISVGDTISDFSKSHKSINALNAIDDARHGLPTQGLETITYIDGKQRYVLWSIAPLVDGNKNVCGAIAQGQDITERRLIEKRLMISTQVFDNTAEAILITDAKGIIIDVNMAFSDITGYGREEVIGFNPSIMKSGKHSKEFYESMWTELKNAGIWRGEIWDKRKNGDIYPKWLSISAARNDKGDVVNYVAVFSDVTRNKENEAKLEKMAHFDALTNLPNRVLFQDRLYTALARAKRDEAKLAVLFVDLDRFKQVNDTLGHRVGDLLLKEVSKRLVFSVREIDTVARLSGDEFTVILTDITTTEDIELISSRIVKSIGAPYFFEGHELFISASVGISVYPADGETNADLLRHADVAMYHAKEKGRNNFQFFDARMNDLTKSHMSLANQLRIGLNRNVIKPHYQLKVDIRTGLPVGLEALARWTNDEGVQISPVEFIAVAEEHGLIVKVGMAIMRQACEQARMWIDMNFEFGTIAVNLSAQQFRDKNLIKDMTEIMEDFRLDPSRIEIEVTENMMMDDVEDAIRILNDFKQMGMKVSIDDFGTGYSSLSYLKRFPVDTLKIDRSFVCDLKPGSDDAAIVAAIVSLAKTLKIDVVAEGVETIEQSDYLRSIGCNIVQGYLYAKPCSGAEIPLVWIDVEEKFGL